MRNLISTTKWPRLVAFAALVAGALIPSDVAVAQQTDPSIATSILRYDGVWLPLTRPANRGFNLFAEEDWAGASVRLTGIYQYPLLNNGGLCPFATSGGDLFNTGCGRRSGTGTFFSANSVWGIGLKDYAKIKEAFPDVAKNMRTPEGFSTPWRVSANPPVTFRINSADGQFGQFFSGVTSLDGAGCRDHTGNAGAGLIANLTLLAVQDCPETWAGTGYDGVRQIADSVWLKHFRAEGTAFTWDDFRIPKEEQGAFLGTNSTYGAFSDYTREHLQQGGGTTPRGVAGQPPVERGFPIGIYVRADAWKFDRPSLRDGVFVRWLVTNNTEKVWGKGIDLETLHMGIGPDYQFGGQSPASYNVPGRGVHIAGGGGFVSGRCTNSYPRRLGSAGTSCEGAGPLHLIMFLKSPLGDLRNKRFTIPTDSFYSPNHPERDDTITFNHFRRGGFGFQDALSWRRSDRSLYGLISGDEELWLDGRPFTDISAGNIWTYWRYEGTDGTQSRANIRYNRSVPGAIAGYGSWDYNEDGVQDTIMVPDCGVQGCAVLWSDTIAGGFDAQSSGNIGQYMGVGPFELKAGETKEFIWYMGANSTANNDTLAMNRLITAVTQAYVFDNYAGASQYPTPAFTAADVTLNSAWFRDSTSDNQNTEVRIRIRMPPRKDDAFLKTVVDRLKQNDALAVKLRNLNPGLVAIVEGRMRQNLAQLLVFKTCDNGTSWTNDAGCTSATSNFRTRDQNGTDIGLGWRPRNTISVDSITGALSASVVTDEVQSGREYLYSFVTKTRGLADVAVIDSLVSSTTGTSPSGSPCTVAAPCISFTRTRNLKDILAVDIDTITSALSPNGPHTVKAYAPVSVPAGTLYARLDTSRVQGQEVSNAITATTRVPSSEGSFRMRFGNRFIVIRRFDTVTASETHTLIRQSVYRGTATTGGAATSESGPRLGSPAAAPVYVAAADTFTANHPFFYSARPSTAAGAPPGTIDPSRAFGANPDSTIGPVKVFYDTVNAAGYVVAKAANGTDAFYLSVGNGCCANFTGTGGNDSGLVQNTGDYELATYYPGFNATVAGDVLSPTLRRTDVVLRSFTGAAEDTIDRGVVGGSGVVYAPLTLGFGLRQPAGSARGGTFRVRWQGDSFGPSVPFTWGPAIELQPALDASLLARPVASYTDTSAAFRAVIMGPGSPDNVAGSGIGTRPLIRARLPFTVQGSGGGPAKLVMFQRHQTGNAADSIFRNSIMLGTTGDTTRVSIPPDAWMPGDTLWAFESVIVDSTATVGTVANVVIVRDTVVRDASGFDRVQSLPIRVTRELLTLKFSLRCASGATPARVTCNPIRLGTRGSNNSYLPYENGWEHIMGFTRTFDQNSEMALTAQPTRASALPLTTNDMKRIQVVPNPFVVQSGYDQLLTNRAVNFPQVRFVNVPEAGTVRIYTISGQLMQQLTWTKSDLVASVNGTQHGDLPFNLRSREGLEMSSGLYIFIMTAQGDQRNLPCVHPVTGGALIDPETDKPLGCENVARGKFVIIR